MTVFSLFFICLFLFLGNWQLHRYYFKKKLLNEYQQQQTTAPISILQAMHKKNQEFLPVKATGHYLNQHTIYLANQLRQHVSGFDVLTPFKLNNSPETLLVDRGWIANKDLFVPANPKLLHITGYLKSPEQHVFYLGPLILNHTDEQITIQKIALAKISNLTSLKLAPIIFRLSPNQDFGFWRQWQPFSVQPSRHMGYAIQWLLMAITLLFAYFFFLKKSYK